MYDIVVIGAGPAGLTAALYARRADKKVLVIEKETFGGQITYSPKVENYPGIARMSGSEFADMLLEQVLSMGAEIELDTANEICKNPDGTFTVKADSAEYNTKTVIIAAGSKHRTLGLDREEELVGEGVSYCAVCDGAFYAGKDVAVIGGGNSALQEAVLLSEYCKSVTLIQNLSFFTGEAKLLEILKSRENVKFITDTVVTALVGEESLTAIELQNTDGEKSVFETDAIFVAIGQKPENEIFEGIVSLDENGYIDCDETCIAPTGGIFAAGDCRRKRIRQITTATADGASAAIAACRFIDGI